MFGCDDPIDLFPRRHFQQGISETEGHSSGSQLTNVITVVRRL